VQHCSGLILRSRAQRGISKDGAGSWFETRPSGAPHHEAQRVTSLTLRYVRDTPNLVVPHAPLSKVEFTGVRYAKTPHVTPRERRKTLTSFRESETPLRRLLDFSRAFPRLHLCPVRWLLRAEVPFSRHFSVTHGGIKTYLSAPRKKLFARSGRPILPAFLRSLSPQFTGRTQDLVFDSDLMSISC
jgi:hypothetical protein